MISFPSFEPLLNIGYLAASQATRAGRAPHSQCCAPLARTLHVTCRGLLRLRGAQRPYVQLDNASRCILLSLHCVLSLLPRVSDGHPQASARGGLSVERPLHSCMPCPFRCPMYLSLFRLRLPEYTVLLFFCARRLVWSLSSLFPVQRVFAYAAFCLLSGPSAPGRWDSTDMEPRIGNHP